jgi:hypothetical protein
VLTAIDWFVVCAPFVLGVGGAWVSIWPPKRRYHWVIGRFLFLLGIGGAWATLYQIRQTRMDDQKQRVNDEADKKALRDEVDGLKKQVGVLSYTSIPKLLGDVNGLKPPPKAPLPDLTARFVNPQEVAIAIDNAPHAGVAYQPKYGVTLSDLDNISADLLRIPTEMGDDIRPGESWGPNQFMGLAAVKSVVKPGDRIFGGITVSCPTCAKTRGYRLFITWIMHTTSAPGADPS